MRYAELRRKLRAQGFINAEIATIHMQYLSVKALGVEDDEILFDREHGLLMHMSAKEKYQMATEGMRLAPDVKNDCVYIMHDDGTATKLGPF